LENIILKNYFKVIFIGLCLLTFSLSVSMTGCGKKGDLIYPKPTQSPLEKAEALDSKTPKAEALDSKTPKAEALDSNFNP
jgi:predicted small lipoprotein YifL